MKKYLRNFKFASLILFSYVIYGSIIYTSKESYCNLNIRNIKLCKVISIASKPTEIFISGYRQTKLLVKNRSTSGLLAKNLKEINKRFENIDPGFTFYYPPKTKPYAGYLLLSVSSAKNNGYPLIELWDMNLQKRIHKYKFNLKKISEALGLNLDERRIRFAHPLLLNDGSLIINGVDTESGKKPIIKLDKCGEYITSNNEYITHHSLEMDKFGNIYSPISGMKINAFKELHHKNFIADGIGVFDENLNLIKTYSLLEIYKKNDLLGDIYGNYELINDPFHLNDVQPYISSNKNVYLLLSMKGHSRIMVFNSDSLKVLWFVDRATSLQHDVDVIMHNDDSIDITIFDNNSKRFSFGKEISQENRIAKFTKLPIKEFSNPISISDKNQFRKYNLEYIEFKYLDEELRPKTPAQGRSDFLTKNNSVMVEETHSGRLLEVDTNENKLLWQYLNKKKGGPTFMASWSRRMQNLPNGLNENTFDTCNQSL